MMSSDSPIVSIAVAVSKNNAIGKDNQLLWHLPNDLKFFKKITSGHSIIMGRKTFESIGRPLPNRRNIVLTNSTDFNHPDVVVAHSIPDVLQLISKEEKVFVIGGADIYRQFLPLASEIYLTKVDVELEGDAYFPVLSEKDWTIVSKESYSIDERHHYSYSFVHLIKK